MGVRPVYETQTVVSESAVTRLRLLHGYKFRAEFCVEGMPDLVLDELKPIEKTLGQIRHVYFRWPLVAAFARVFYTAWRDIELSSRISRQRLILMLKEMRQDGCEQRVWGVQMHVDVAEKDGEKLSRCLGIFENYCTVNQTVKKGIEVLVNIK
jgi:hypothetical protein